MITLLGLIKKGVQPIVKMVVTSWKGVIDIKVLELFGGIGACTQAFKRLNIPVEVVDYVEIDKYAVKSYNAINYTNFEPQDITKWDKDVTVDFIMHGSPCQDFSVAGLGKGGDEGSETRSSLLYETVRIVDKLRPQYVLWENVKNVLSKKHRHNFDKYLDKMENLGYTNYYQVLNAKDYNIPQNRERVFVLSMLNNTGFEFPTKIERTRNLSDMLEDVVDEKFYISNEKAEKLISQLKDLRPQTLTANYRRVEKQDTEIAGALVSTDLVSMPGNFGGTNCVCTAHANYKRIDKVYTDVAKTLCARDYKGFGTGFDTMNAVIEPMLIGGEQANQAVKTDGVSTCLTSAMGSGGGYVPMVTEVGYLPWGESDKKHQSNTVYSSYGIAPTLSATDYKNPPKFSVQPCLTPDRIKKRQNGRRFKEDGEDMFTLTGQDRHGVLQVGNIVDTGNWDNPQRGRIYSIDGISPSLNCVGGGGLEPKILQAPRGKNKGSILENCPTITKNAWEENHAVILDDTKSEAFGGGKCFEDCPTLRSSRYGHKVIKNNDYRIRKLTPKECWRLMGFRDECFEKAEQVNSNSQLYKQAGNSIVVDVLVCIISQLMIAKSKWLDELLGGEN